MNDYRNPIQQATQPSRLLVPGAPRIVTPRMSGGMGRLTDYVNVVAHATMPARALVHPEGPADTPVVKANPPAASLNDLLQQMRQNNDPQRGVFRTGNITVGGGDKTLDWSMLGMMARIVLVNHGPFPVFFAFDISGPQIDAFASDNSFMIKSDSSYNADTIFYKVGVRCAAGATALVQATAWPYPSVGQGVVV